MKKIILVGVSGGIAAYKSLELVSSLVKNNFDVRVIMTKSATRIVSPEQFKKTSGKKVYLELFDSSFDYKAILKNRSVDHVSLANQASLFVIVPATANVIAKIATGIADDYLTTTAVAATCPIMIAPSMNVFMWKNPVVQQNIKTLHTLGMHIIGPDSGMLACGYEGEGRLIDVSILEKEVIRMANRSEQLKGKRIIITAGGTTEPIDDVRVLTNRSSGKMGAAIAESCFLRGADVLILRSQTSVSPRYGIKEMLFDSADSLQKLLKSEIPNTDICVHAAAVSDFQISQKAKGKISSDKPLPLELTPRTKILDKIKSYNPNIFLVAFKAEWGVSNEKLISLASSRLNKAGADLVVANDVGRSGQGFQSNDNEVFIISKKKEVTHVPKSPKSQIAEKILDVLTELV